MPNQRKPIDTIPLLVERVEEIIKKATEKQTNQSNTEREVEDEIITEEQTNKSNTDGDPLVHVLSDILIKLQEMKTLFPNFNRCEEFILNEFKSLQQLFDDEIIENNPTQKEKVNQMLISISGKIDIINFVISKIQLPEDNGLAPATQSGAPAMAPTRVASEDWMRLSVDEHILASPAMANLQLSYDVLDLQLKLCLLCFAIFPFKAVIKKRPLIHWWIGESLISKSKDKTAEEVGESIFMDLIKKGLILPLKKSEKNPIIDSCKIHPWIQRMLISVATRAEFFNFEANGKISDNYSKSHRAFLVRGNEGFSGESPAKEEELLTMFNVDEQFLSFKSELFLKFKKLASLQLGRWQNSSKHHIEVENEQFLDELRAQKHLKYLSLHGVSRITRLPSSILECSNLEILDLRACHNLERLPSDISSFGKLTHLDISECYLLETMPKAIEKLSSLQVLKGFVIGHSRKNPCKLGDLIKLEKLRKLSINIRSEASIEEDELKTIKDFRSLRILTITWGGVVLPSKIVDPKTNSRAQLPVPQLTRTATLTMSTFSFPPTLEKLDLNCFPRPMSPDWLTASNLKDLKRLYIRGGELLNLRSRLEQKWNVEILRLKYLKNLEVEANDIVEKFPNLRYFEKVRCSQIAGSQYEKDVEWSVDEGLEALKSALEHPAQTK